MNRKEKIRSRLDSSSEEISCGSQTWLILKDRFILMEDLLSKPIICVCWLLGRDVVFTSSTINSWDVCKLLLWGYSAFSVWLEQTLSIKSQQLMFFDLWSNNSLDISSMSELIRSFAI